MKQNRFNGLSPTKLVQCNSRSLKLITMLLLIFGLSNLHAQETVTSSGGEATGSGGTASYTVGQTVYTTETGTNGNSMAQGVQQPFEISVVTGIPGAKGINLSVSAYPNPTSDYLTVKVENHETDNLRYQVFGMEGKLLKTIKAAGTETQINTNDIAPANYLLKVLDNNKTIKVFKIIKK